MGRFVSKETRESLRIVAHVTSMGWAMVLSIVIGGGGGYYFDNWAGTHPYGLFVGLAMGIVAGYRSIYIILKRLRKL